MVGKLTSVLSLTGNGPRDWLIQRISSLIITAYIVFLFAFFILHPKIDYLVWQGLFRHLEMRLGSSLFLLSLFWHAWVGVWTIITDYVRPTGLRLGVTLLMVALLVVYLMWGLSILWGI